MRQIWLAIFLLGAAGTPAFAEDEFIETSPMDELILEYISAHPASGVEEVAAYANDRLPQVGIDFSSWLDERPPDDILVLDAGSRKLRYRTPGLYEEDPCDNYEISLPVVRVTDQWIDIIHRGELVRVQRPADLYYKTFTFYDSDQRTVLNKLAIPYDTNVPLAVDPQGCSVLVEYYLNLPSAVAWWQNVRTAHPEFTDKYPHLRLLVGPENFRFVGDPAAYVDEPSEWVDDFPNPNNYVDVNRLRFPRSGVEVEYFTACN